VCASRAVVVPVFERTTSSSASSLMCAPCACTYSGSFSSRAGCSLRSPSDRISTSLSSHTSPRDRPPTDPTGRLARAPAAAEPRRVRAPRAAEGDSSRREDRRRRASSRCSAGHRSAVLARRPLKRAPWRGSRPATSCVRGLRRSSPPRGVSSQQSRAHHARSDSHARAAAARERRAARAPADRRPRPRPGPGRACTQSAPPSRRSRFPPRRSWR
jgi:hypothetical protein